MKILYLDLNCSGEFFESYSCNPKRYGGGGCFARWAKEILNENNNIFKIIAPKKCFQDIQSWENNDSCVAIDDLKIFEYIKSGYDITKIFNGLENFDIICTHNIFCRINKGNLKIPVVCWSPFGDCDYNDPSYNYSLCYNHESKQKYVHQPIKYIKIGKPIPSQFIKKNKEDFIFQCTQHSESFNSIEIAKNCLKYGVRGIFAGPIHDNYNLKDFIDDKLTFYLGEISEESKLDYTSRATLYSLYLTSDVPFNQSAIEANSLGTPILSSGKGWMNRYIKENINGYFYNGNNFLDIYSRSKEADGQKCWEASREFSSEKMIESFKQAFSEIINEFK